MKKKEAETSPVHCLCMGMGPKLTEMLQCRSEAAQVRKERSCQLRLGDALAQHRRIAPGGMKSGNAFLLQEQNVGTAAPRQLISGGGAGKTSADDDIFEGVHDFD